MKKLKWKYKCYKITGWKPDMIFERRDFVALYKNDYMIDCTQPKFYLVKNGECIGAFKKLKSAMRVAELIERG